MRNVAIRFPFAGFIHIKQAVIRVFAVIHQLSAGIIGAVAQGIQGKESVFGKRLHQFPIVRHGTVWRFYDIVTYLSGMQPIFQNGGVHGLKHKVYTIILIVDIEFGKSELRIVLHLMPCILVIDNERNRIQAVCSPNLDISLLILFKHLIRVPMVCSNQQNRILLVAHFAQTRQAEVHRFNRDFRGQQVAGMTNHITIRIIAANEAILM